MQHCNPYKRECELPNQLWLLVQCPAPSLMVVSNREVHTTKPCRRHMEGVVSVGCFLFCVLRLFGKSTPATWGVDSGYLDSGYPTLATYKADTGYPTLATPTLATYKGWHRLPIGGDTGYLFFSVPLLDKVMFFECLEIYANVIKRIF